MEPDNGKDFANSHDQVQPGGVAMAMSQNQREISPQPASANAVLPVRKSLKFGRNNEFQAALRRRVDEFFQTTGRPRRDVPQMYFKTAVLLVSFVVLYLSLVFLAATWWQALPLAVLLALVVAGIGFNVQHDGGHHAYSERPWVNKLMAKTLDLIGGSSYLWHYKHGVYHHTYVNITGHDTDIDLGALARLSPHQVRRAFHRWQHLYIWPLYGMAVIKWHLFDDFKEVITGRIGDHRIPRPKGWDLVTFIGGKALFLCLAFGIPMLFHPPGVVVLFYLVAAAVAGMVISVVFQLAHAVEDAEFPMPQEGSDQIENAWAIHQVESTINFARSSRVVAWLLGGLNFQIEHHLLPRICHVNFPAMSEMVKNTCREYGVKYAEHASFFAGVASHYRWLREMGKPSG
jgi:linoleoyl-CoA desaturase